MEEESNDTIFSSINTFIEKQQHQTSMKNFSEQTQAYKQHLKHQIK